MTRPHIIRADTIDLQDKSSPTAQDHQSNPHPAPLGIGPAAPHQQATLRAVEDERETEEVNLANSLRDDPGSDDESTVVHNGTDDNAAVRLNGGISGDDAETADADVDDDLDDMDDRISSSPSISDGSLPSHSPHWRKRALSSSPTSLQSGSSSTACDSSSPFTDAPIHFPMSVVAARRPLRVPAGGADLSPTIVSFPSQDIHSTPSTDHHHGEYWPRTTSGSPHKAITGHNRKISPRTQHMTAIEDRLQDIREDSQGSLISDLDDAMLQPVPSPSHNDMDDPFTEGSKTSFTPTSGKGTEGKGNAQAPMPPCAPNQSEESDSWTTDSDCDSWDDNLEDDDLDVSFSDDPRFIDSGWGGDCLTDTEDIDFEFVYALHTFVATVEGQANATKGDTMVLLDDSNSYWWLVRVVKDSSIGYLPAEHIETPTERLARLNKHRNIDLSATMLGDTAEKTKNPLKKAMRRRNAKTVQFAPPTYVEASDYDYSSDEGGDEDLFGGTDPNQAQAQQQQASATETDEPEGADSLSVQPLKVNGAKKESQSRLENETGDSTEEGAKGDMEKLRTSDEIFDRPMDPKVSRNGTLRNTDSFFRDENTETRKITLTPNLLRDDSSTSTTGSRERGPSLESLEKNGFADKVKKDEKKKEKKSGMLSGLFKRKDKKTKGASDSFDSDAEKQSDEFGRSSPQSKPSDDLSAERPSAESSPAPSRQASKGKLQKPQRPTREDSPSKTKGILKTVDSPESSPVQTVAAKEPSSDKPTSQATSTMRLVAPEEDSAKTTIEERALSPENTPRAAPAASKLNPINMLKTQQSGDPRPEKVKKAKQRVQLDDFDSEDEDKTNPFADPDLQTQSAQPSETEPTGRLSESPVHVSAADAQPLIKENAQERDQDFDSQHPPGLTGDTSSQETSSPISTPTLDDSPSTSRPDKPRLATSRPDTSPSPTRLAPSLSIPQPLRPAPVPQNQKEMDFSPPDSSESTTLPAWSDSSLRSYLDDGSDIRDMMLVINDTTGVVPVGRDHPLMAKLYVEESKAISGLSSELDALLNGLLEKRMKRAKSASPTAIKAGR